MGGRMGKVREEISVIIGVYNHLKYLPRLIEAWQKQTYKDFKLYIADDGSSDGTKEWAEKNAKKLNFRYFWQENKGMRLAKSLNNALRVATGKYALFAMGDSLPIPEYLEKFKPYLNQNWVLCGVRENVSEDLEHIGWDWRFRTRESQLSWNFIPIQSHQWARITGNGMLIPMKALKKVGYWPEEFVGYGCDDNYLAVELFAQGLEFGEVPKAILKHIEHSVQPDNKDNMGLFESKSREIFTKLKEELKPQTICLNFDDFSPINNNLFFLQKLKHNYPNLKVSMFTIPATIQSGQAESLLKHRRFCDEIRKELDWIEILPHGWHHPDSKQGENEFKNITYWQTSQYIKMVDEIFKEVNLPYKKIFKPPQYSISKAAKDCFRDNGWALAVKGTGEYWPKDIKTIHYNWNINDVFPLRKVIISYGHIQDIGNGLHGCWENLLQMPTDAKFVFMSELIK
jgi:glycosyltransferase involved in cell wall biosynthesis